MVSLWGYGAVMLLGGSGGSGVATGVRTGAVMSLRGSGGSGVAGGVSGQWCS